MGNHRENKKWTALLWNQPFFIFSVVSHLCGKYFSLMMLDLCNKAILYRNYTEVTSKIAFELLQ